MSLERRRQMIEPEHPQLSVVRQCELVHLSYEDHAISGASAQRPGFSQLLIDACGSRYGVSVVVTPRVSAPDAHLPAGL